MSRAFSILGCAALGVSLALIPEPSAAASSFAGLAEANTFSRAPGIVETVQYRGSNGYRRGSHGRNYGRNAGLGIGAAIIGGIILSEAARAQHRQEHGGAWERCAQTYRSFEPSTGMYTGYDGERHTCPYLN